jgi:hypothetical protein
MSNSNKIVALIIIIFSLLILACEPERVVIGSGSRDIAGTYLGFSWTGEVSGTAFEDANQYIETMIQLDSDATIVNAWMRYWQKVDGFWITRQAQNASVRVDLSATPAAATIEGGYRAGRSLFSVYTANTMSLFTVAVGEDGTLALGIVDPITRFWFEAKLPPGFDYNRPFGDLTYNNNLMVPTIRAAGGALVTPTNWNHIGNETVFSIHEYSKVLTDRGVFQGLSNSSSVRDVVSRLGVTFTGNTPEAKSVSYGYTGIGGWAGNYTAIAQYLIGRNARELTSLVDWSAGVFQGSINEQNQFGVDVASGATRTAQNSVDGIAGATVRMSRESTSFQRALVSAGIIQEEDVIIGRF